MDQDGYARGELTDGRTLALTPRFSPTAQEITYLSYYRNKPRVYLLNIETGQQEVVGDFPGMTFAPRFSPDGQKIVMSLERNGNSNIYTMDLRTRELGGLPRLSPLIPHRATRPMAGKSFSSPTAWAHSKFILWIRRHECAAHQLWRGPICNTCVVAARRFDRFYQNL